MRYMVRTVSAMLTAMIASCPVAHAAWTGGKEEKINANTYREILYFDAPSRDDMQWDFWIWNCAQLAKRNGFDVIVETPDPQPSRRTGSTDSTPRFIPAVAYGREGAAVVQTHGSRESSRVTSPTYTYTTKYYITGVIQMYKESDTFDSSKALRVQPIIDALDAYMKSGAKIAPPSRADVFSNARIVAPPASPSGV